MLPPPGAGYSRQCKWGRPCKRWKRIYTELYVFRRKLTIRHLGAPKTSLRLQHWIFMHAPLHSRFAPTPKSIIHEQILVNMIMSPKSARTMHQHKITCPNHFRHNTQRLGNNHSNHLEKLTEKVHAERSSLPHRASVKHIPNHIMGKMCMCRTETRHFHRTEVQFKHFFQVETHKHLTDLLQYTHTNIRNFWVSKAHKTVWNSKEKFNITKSMWAEINFLYSMSTSHTAFQGEIPTRHATPADCDCIVPGDACLTECGAHWQELKFWFFVAWTTVIRRRTLKYLKSKSS